jgi:hypothetical protein
LTTPPSIIASNQPYNSKLYNTVVAIQSGKANPQPLTAAAGWLLGGDWTPWNSSGERPAWFQQTFELEGQRVWAALCIEQLLPWTWLQALIQKPTVILAISNEWWAAPNSFAPRIQIASTKAWARLMKVPVIWASNFPAAPIEPP